MNSAPNCNASTEDFEFAALGEAKNYRAALIKEFAPYLSGNVLEVGAGLGQLSEALLKLNAIDSLTSVEPDAHFCSQIRSNLPQLRLIEGTVKDLPPGSGWNAILSVNVLEHIDDDVQELTTYCDLLRAANGVLCLFVPARQEIYAPIDRDFGHFRRYNRTELNSRLKTAGFKSVKIRYYNSLGYFLWWLSFRLLKKRSFNPILVRLYDRLAFPLIYRFESYVAPPLIGQSLLIVARS